MTFSGRPASRWIGSGPSCRTATGRPASIKGPQDQRGRLIGRTKGGLNTRLHAVTDAKGRPLPLFLTAGQVSDHANAAALPGSLPAAEGLIPDQGYRTDRFGESLKDNGIRPCIPGRKSRKDCPTRQATLSAMVSVSRASSQPLASPAREPSDLGRSHQSRHGVAMCADLGRGACPLSRRTATVSGPMARSPCRSPLHLPAPAG